MALALLTFARRPMASLLTARNLPGTGDFDPPDDLEAPDCYRCDGTGGVRCTCHRGTCHRCGMRAL